MALALALAALLAAGPTDRPAAHPSTAARPRRLEVGDLARIARVSDPQVSPDGRSVVVVVARPNLAKDRYDADLVLVDIATGARRALTFDREGVGHPRWSPSGDRIAFLAKGGPEKEARPQLFMLPMNGGDARRVTNAGAGVQHFAWRPNGREIAYACPDESPTRRAAEKYDDAFEVGDDSYLVTSAPAPAHVWLVPAAGGDARRLTSGAWSLPVTPPPGPPASPLSWSSDGRSLLLVRQERPHFGDADERTVQVLDVATGALRPLTGHPRFEGFPSFSPDGTLVAYWYPRDGDPTGINEVWVTSPSGGPGHCVTRVLDRSLYQSRWLPDGRTLLVGGHDGTRVSLWLQPVDGSARRLELGKVEPSWSFWVDASVGHDGAIAFTASEPDRPTELYYLSAGGGAPRRISDFNQEIAGRELGRVEPITWDGPDGFHEDGVLVYPPEFSADRKYPLVLLIHGGPRAASTQAFSVLAQLFAAHGYVVFQPNYRGSDNLGNAYQRAIVNDSGDGPGRDVMAGLEAVKRRSFVDNDRVAVSGWSYGGYMTTWLLGHFGGWKTAVAGAAVTDLNDQYNLSDSNVSRRYTMGGSPWVNDRERRYREQSPITYAAQIKTPTLILSDTGDARVPISNSFRLYHALKDNHVPVKFVAYPIAGHSPADPVRLADVYRRWLAWLDEHLQ